MSSYFKNTHFVSLQLEHEHMKLSPNPKTIRTVWTKCWNVSVVMRSVLDCKVAEAFVLYTELTRYEDQQAVLDIQKNRIKITILQLSLDRKF